MVSHSHPSHNTVYKKAIVMLKLKIFVYLGKICVQLLKMRSLKTDETLKIVIDDTHRLQRAPMVYSRRRSLSP